MNGILDSSAQADIHSFDFCIAAAALQTIDRPPNLHAQTAAMCELSKAVSDDPAKTLRSVLDVARHLCGAGSAGLSMLRRSPSTGKDVIQWQMLSGALFSHEGIELSRTDSPSGLCLEKGIAILIFHPERVFASLVHLPPAIVETLLVPLYDRESIAVGTLWIANHDRNTHFHSDDARVLEQLAAYAILALRLQQQQHEHHRELQYKDAIIAEVNHRAKNTLQVASNLLSLHARDSACLPARDALRDSASRLTLLARVHELLYADPANTQSVSMAELLWSLCEGLRQSFGSLSQRVTLQTIADPIVLPAQDAVALSLLANEVVTNAYKHAFPGGVTGEITVRLRQALDGSIILTIGDNGIGLRPAARTGGIGLKLIRTLAEQLRGVLEVVTLESGTQLMLTIKPANT